MKFTSAVLESIKNDTKRIDVDAIESSENGIEPKPQDTLKNLALKILSLKVAAFLKWNLDIWELKLSIKTQICLLQDLFYFTKEKIEIPNIPEYDLSSVSDQFLFTLILYHRWVIRMAVQQSLQAKIMKPPIELQAGLVDDYFMCTPELIMNSVNFLTNILTSNHFPPVLTFDTFQMLTEDSKEVEHNWEKSIEVSAFEYEAQVHYDLGCFYFNRENYAAARNHFLKSSESYYGLNVDADLEYASFDMRRLNGYLNACDVAVLDQNPSLLQQMNASIADQYTGILQILQEDNLVREIPNCYRTVLELDIQGALSSGKFTVARDLLQQVQALNAIRGALDGGSQAPSDLIHQLCCGGSRSVDILLKAISSFIERGSEEDKAIVRKFLLNTLRDAKLPSDILDKVFTSENGKWLQFLGNDEVRTFMNQEEMVCIPDSLLSDDWMKPPGQARHLENRSLERKLAACYDSQQISKMLAELASIGSSNNRASWRTMSACELAIPLQSVVGALPRGSLQDLSYVLLAKSKQLMTARDYDRSLDLLSVLEQEARNAQLQKLCRLISWEALLVKVNRLHVEWPQNSDQHTLVSDCKQCLSALDERGDGAVLPRLEIVERCALCLLNCGEWEYLCGLEKRWNYFEMAAAVAYACQDLIKYKGGKKVSRDMWDLTLPVFGPLQQNQNQTTQTKRTSSGASTIVHRDSPGLSTNAGRAQLIAFLAGLRDATALSVVISMLARLYNVLRDEPSLELNVQHVTLWPAVVSNANSYNWRSALETVSQLVMQALRLYPSSITWLRLSGDIAFALSHYEAALRKYLESLSIATDHFDQPPQAGKGGADEHCIKRMVKCCVNIGCHTQAAILSQFVDDMDYALAFKYLSESKTVQACYDSVDAYYACIWDTTLLEYLVHLHHKRGEYHRKQQAIKAIGMLELNSNNNEEIQREAMNVRKSRFLRALSNHYLTKSV